MKGKYLITTDEWFIAPDGQSYKSVWGEVLILEDSIIGLKTNRNSTNWYAKIGNEEKHIIVAGCQIHYALKCEERPKLHKHIMEEVFEGKQFQSKTMTRIYLAE